MGRSLLAAVAIALVSPVSTPAGAAATDSLLISPSDLAAALADGGVVVLHVVDREAAFAEGHIPGARFLRYGAFAVDGPEGLGSELPPIDEVKQVFEAVGVSDASTVVVYGGSPVAAARAFFTLDVMGHPRVRLLDGGLPAWQAEKRPIERGAPAAAPRGRFTPRLDMNRLATAQFVQEQLASRGIALVDVRPDPEYLGTDGGIGGAHAVGHIAGARQLPWQTLVGPDGRFLPRDQLQQRLASAGVVAGKPVVSYCMIGMRASVVYFVARHLGFDARLYDGSITDWTLRKLPTVTGRQ